MTIVLAAELSGVIAKLAADVETLAAKKFKGEIGGIPVSTPPDTIQLPRSRTPPTKQPDQKQVLLTLDNWLREQLIRVYAGATNTTTAVRETIELALGDEYKLHLPIVRSYASGITEAKQVVHRSAQSGLEAIRSVLIADM